MQPHLVDEAVDVLFWRGEVCLRAHDTFHHLSLHTWQRLSHRLLLVTFSTTFPGHTMSSMQQKFCK